MKNKFANIVTTRLNHETDTAKAIRFDIDIQSVKISKVISLIVLVAD